MSSSLPYRFDKQLANGRYGNIYLAYSRNNEKVVIKQVDLITLKRDDKLLIQKEVDIQRDLSSPYIVRFIESCNETGYQFIALEYCDGGDLATLISSYRDQQRHFPQSDVLCWSYQILKGLSYLHNHNIIHRDIKPENIILSKGPNNSLTCKISDFGLSWKLSRQDETVTTFTGTPIYMAPEVILGEPYNQLVDIWSMGCVVVELCNLIQPYNDDDINVVMNNILDGPIPKIISHYTTDVINLSKQLLVKSPRNRPSANDVLNNRSFIKFKYNDIDNPYHLSKARMSGSAEKPSLYYNQNIKKTNSKISSRFQSKPQQRSSSSSNFVPHKNVLNPHGKPLRNISAPRSKLGETSAKVGARSSVDKTKPTTRAESTNVLAYKTKQRTSTLNVSANSSGEKIPLGGVLNTKTSKNKSTTTITKTNLLLNNSFAKLNNSSMKINNLNNKLTNITATLKTKTTSKSQSSSKKSGKKDGSNKASKSYTVTKVSRNLPSTTKINKTSSMVKGSKYTGIKKKQL